MALTDEQIVAQNPWWTNAAWRGSDSHLTLLESQPVRLAADFVAGLDLQRPGVHVLRGPRQVGKSTDLKLLVERALDGGLPGRAVVYLALDLLEGRHLSELAATIQRALDLAGRGPLGEGARGLLLLDEVTAVADWQTAVKSLWDSGAIRGEVVVCTGSSAVDLQRGAAERLPGRRGAGADHLALPQSFAAFARAVDGDLPASPRLTVAELCSRDGEALLREMRVYAPMLDAALGRYLRFGGLPAAVAEAASGAHEPSREVRRVLYDSLVRELRRRGASVPAGHALLERVVRSLGSKVSWSAMAREMDVPLGRGTGRPSHQTLRDYIELLAGGYFLFVTYFWRSGTQSNELSRDKKVFLADPLLHTIALDGAPGLAPNVPALVENAVGMALLRRYEPAERLLETFILPERLHIWQTARGGEIDFVCGPRRELDVVEVKYRENPTLSAAAAAARAHPGRPAVMATKSELRVTERYTLLPAHTLLWALG
jgi:predicted AAA+ superfamily ATPase